MGAVSKINLSVDRCSGPGLPVEQIRRRYVEETRAAAGIGRADQAWPQSRDGDAEFAADVRRLRLRELAAVRRRFGYRRLHVLMQREGFVLNHKKLRRLYREEQLQAPPVRSDHEPPVRSDHEASQVHRRTDFLLTAARGRGADRMTSKFASRPTSILNQN
jgi:hypothetical protein